MNTSVANAAPDPRLASYIRSYVQRTFDLGTGEFIEPVVARLGTMLEFQFLDPYLIPSYADGAPNNCPLVTLIGPITYRRVRLLIRGRVEALAVMFRPLGLHELFGVPTGPLAEIGTDASAVLGAGVTRLHQRLGEVATLTQRAALLDEYFLSSMRPDPADPMGVALRKLSRGGDGVEVNEIASDIGMSVRQFQRRSLDYAGVSPKTLTRVSRFQRALAMSDEKRLLTEIAHASDYFDQSHMVRDFRIMAGASPRRAFAQIAPSHLILF